MNTAPYLAITVNLAAAMVAGSVVGLERTWNGRVAGFRTHALIALAAATAMTLVFAPEARPSVFSNSGLLEAATRVAQGVMAGVGFVGVGVIFKEGVSIQGLTTAASVWATAAVGLLCGAGLWPAAAAATLIILFVLTAMHWLELRLPTRVRAQAAFRYRAAEAPDRAGFQLLMDEYEVHVVDLSYRLSGEGEIFEYRAQIDDRSGQEFDALAQRLRTVPGLVEFELERISK